jgi:aldehyde:ferredoxin oxidoreductase
MRFLYCDLTHASLRDREIPGEDMRSFLGGSGLAAKMLLEETGPQTDPLGPDNILIFANGPMTGTGVPCSGRHGIVAKSPLTGIFGESDVGGRWGTTLSRTGYDGIVFRGRAASPALLLVSEEGVEIRSAEHLWGLDTYETAREIKGSVGQKTEAACIGPAGERQVPVAAIMHDASHARAAGRCGLGAVMGSKNLKAVVVQGGKSPQVADRQGLKSVIKDLASRFKQAGEGLNTCGTGGGIPALEENGDLPIKNFRLGKWPGAERISGQLITDSYLTGKFHCGACPIGCGREIEIREGPHAGVAGAGPEYESLASLGSYCLVQDLEAICRANELCNRYGLDTISTGAAVAFAMEAYERGDLQAGDFDGQPDLSWGSAEGMLDLVRQIGENRDLGRILGRGVKEASRRLRGLSQEYALEVKGLELPAHDPRAFFSSALSYATSNRGGCHLAGMTHGLEDSLTLPELGFDRVQDRFSNRGKGIMVARMQDLMGVFDSLKMCKFVLGVVDIAELASCFTLATGLEMDSQQLMQAGERIFNLKRLYNVRCGISRKDDRLPLRILSSPREEGQARNQLPHLGRMLHDYYQYRGWNELGIPNPETLERLGLLRFDT